MNSNENLDILQLLKVKGMASAGDITRVLGKTAGNGLQSLLSNGLIKEARSRYRVTPEGKNQLADWLEQERQQIDSTALEAVYQDFHSLNSEFKSLASTWQLRGGEPNDHTDASYDNAVLSQLADLHTRFIPLVERAVQFVPRLSHYVPRFEDALEQVQAGDHGYFLRPIIDSYHTIWFELHEDLIGLTGKSRVEEAAAGRAD